MLVVVLLCEPPLNHNRHRHKKKEVCTVYWRSGYDSQPVRHFYKKRGAVEARITSFLPSIGIEPICYKRRLLKSICLPFHHEGCFLFSQNECLLKDCLYIYIYPLSCFAEKTFELENLGRLYKVPEIFGLLFSSLIF